MLWCHDSLLFQCAVINSVLYKCWRFHFSFLICTLWWTYSTSTLWVNNNKPQFFHNYQPDQFQNLFTDTQLNIHTFDICNEGTIKPKSEDVGLIVRAISFQDFQRHREMDDMQSQYRALHYSASRTVR